MASILPVSTILQIKKICQYLSLNEIDKNSVFKGGALDERAARMIYVEGKSVQIRYNQNPSDSTLISTANYLYSLLGKWALQAQTILANQTIAIPVITGPSNQTVNIGGTAVFSVTVSSSVPYTLQWFDSSNNPIPGATGSSYTFPNAQSSDSGKTFYVKATNIAGTATSTIAVLVVNAVITGYFTYSPTVDFYPILLTNSDPFVYGTSYSITHTAPIVITLPNTMPPDQYMLAKVPIGESIKTGWFNTPLNNGAIPDSVFETVVQFGGFTYYASRGTISMDISQTLTLS